MGIRQKPFVGAQMMHPRALSAASARRTGRYPCLLKVIAAILGILASSCGSDSDSGTPALSTEASWTYMVYMAADNNLWSAGIADVNEMEVVGSTDDVNIVIQAEFSRYYPKNAPGHTLRGRITADEGIDITSPLVDIGERDMADADTLKEFIEWASRTYPARHFALVIWDHGNGWKSDPDNGPSSKGAIEDDGAESPVMNLGLMAQAVAASGVHFDLINFDACYMGMYEVAYEFAGLCDVMAFSEEATPTDGDPYDLILEDLVHDPSMDALSLATLTVSYYEDYFTRMRTSSATKSAVLTASITELHQHICELADLLAATGPDILVQARGTSIDCEDNGDFHDLSSVLEAMRGPGIPEVIRAKAQDCLNALDVAVIANAAYSVTSRDAVLFMKGLSIYLPEPGEARVSDMVLYETLSCNQMKSGQGSTWATVLKILLGYD